jgi:hypothetical protein
VFRVVVRGLKGDGVRDCVGREEEEIFLLINY